MRTSRGFTLIEVLIAMLVLAVAMTAWQLRISSQLDSAGYLRDKTLAQWVALNQLQYLQLASRLGQAPPATVTSGTAQLAERTWYWQLTPLQQSLGDSLTTGSSTLEQAPAPVVITVSGDSAEAARTSPLISLTGVVKPHAPR